LLLAKGLAAEQEDQRQDRYGRSDNSRLPTQACHGRPFVPHRGHAAGDLMGWRKKHHASDHLQFSLRGMDLHR
jgi:hypothetical protein